MKTFLKLLRMLLWVLFFNQMLIFADSTQTVLDTGICGIVINDAKSTEIVLGKELKPCDPAQDLPQLTFYNKDSTELLTLIFHPGDVKNSINEFRVTKSDIPVSCKNIRALKFKSFHSAAGIHLGMTITELTKRLGKPKYETKDEYLTEIKYEIVSNPFLTKANMPSYFGKYIFDDGKLISFSFGLDYP